MSARPCHLLSCLALPRGQRHCRYKSRLLSLVTTSPGLATSKLRTASQQSWPSSFFFSPKHGSLCWTQGWWKLDPGLHVRSWWPSIGLKGKLQDFPGGLVVKHLSANAGDTDLFPHAMELLSPCATTTEPIATTMEAPRPRNLHSALREASTCEAWASRVASTCHN